MTNGTLFSSSRAEGIRAHFQSSPHVPDSRASGAAASRELDVPRKTLLSTAQQSQQLQGRRMDAFSSPGSQGSSSCC